MCTIRHYIRDFVFFSCLFFSVLSFLRNVALISIRDLLSVQFSGARMHNRVLGLGVRCCSAERRAWAWAGRSRRARQEK
jgi:hypothetical protein